AEASDEIVVRLKELNGQQADDVHVKFAAPLESAREVDGQERPIGQAEVKDGELVTSLPLFRMRAFAVKLAATPLKLTAAESHSVKLAYDTDVASTDAKDDDGAFSRKSQSLAAEELPKKITSEGIEFEVGPTADGEKNAVTCRGQTIALPSG